LRKDNWIWKNKKIYIAIIATCGIEGNGVLVWGNTCLCLTNFLSYRRGDLASRPHH